MKLYFYDNFKNRVVSINVIKETPKLYFLENQSPYYSDRIKKEYVDVSQAFSSIEKLKEISIKNKEHQIQNLKDKIKKYEKEIQFFKNERT